VAAVKRVKQKEHENLSDSYIERVIRLLEAEKPITKKEACEILNISYNTTRLTNIIEGYKKRKETEQRLKNKNKGKPATEEEIRTIIINYLEGKNISEISKLIYRSASFVKGIIDRLGVPQKSIGDEKYTTSILPDECVRTEFTPKQIVWSAKYHAPCEIVEEVVNSVDYETKYASKCYKIYVFEPMDEALELYPNKKGGFYAAALACDLGSLEHLSKYNVKFNV
jgi:predicted Zn-ribbon and HTH transcriptional regulator